MAVDDEFVNFHGLTTRSDFREWDEFGCDASDKAGVEGVLLDFLFEDLLNDFVVFHLLGDLDAEFDAFFKVLCFQCYF